MFFSKMKIFPVFKVFSFYKEKTPWYFKLLQKYLKYLCDVVMFFILRNLLHENNYASGGFILIKIEKKRKKLKFSIKGLSKLNVHRWYSRSSNIGLTVLCWSVMTCRHTNINIMFIVFTPCFPLHCLSLDDP